MAPAEPIFLDVKTEAELAELPEDEAAEMAAELGLGEPGLDRLAKAGFAALGLHDVPDRRAEGDPRLDDPASARPRRRRPG